MDCQNKLYEWQWQHQFWTLQANRPILRFWDILIKIYLSARVSKKTVSDCRSAEASEEADQTVANGVVVPKEEPGLELFS